MSETWERDEFLISNDPGRLDLSMLQDFLGGSYWAEGISLKQVMRSISSSRPFGLYQGDRQIGYARVLTDFRSVAYLADVFVLEEFRGKGLARWLVETVLAHEDFKDVQRWELRTADAQKFYAQLGFTPLAQPDQAMELTKPDSGEGG